MSWRSVLLVIVLLAPSAQPNAELSNSASTPALTSDIVIKASVLGPEYAAQALQHLVSLVLRAAGVPASIGLASVPCSLPDSPTCLRSALGALTNGAAVAVLSVPPGASPPAWELREIGIEELGELAPPSRRACLTTASPVRSLLDLVDSGLAFHYHIPETELQQALHLANGINRSYTCEDCHVSAFTPEWCTKETSCATLLTRDANEASILEDAVRNFHLQATVRPLGDDLLAVAAKLESRPLIACDWAPELYLPNLKADLLGPPPCAPRQQCPFETRRLVKFANIRELAHAPSAVRSLVRLKLSQDDIQTLGNVARVRGSETAAKEFLETWSSSALSSEVRVAVLLPNATNRETYDARALLVAAALAEDDIGRERSPGLARFKVEVYDDRCNTVRAYKYLNDALGTSEYGALAALAGPACGAPWTDVARQSPAHRLPVIAYTPQAPANSALDSGADAEMRLQLLAAGDARSSATALGELVYRIGWKRLAVLSEPATRPLIDAARLHAKFEVHVELPDSGSDVDFRAISEWASRVAKDNARIIYLCVEDTRVARAALCAVSKEDMTPEAGVVWLMCSSPKDDWLQPSEGENCTLQQLEKVAAGYISVTPDWENNWKTSNASLQRKAWTDRWRTQCRRLAPVDLCRSPTVHAAVLYDTLRLWVDALDRLILRHPNAVDDLHDTKHVKSLILDATTTNFTGLTGKFEWTAIGGALARTESLIVSQWTPEVGARIIGHWTDDKLELQDKDLQWQTIDGRIPDDGSDQCSIQGFADALHTDCRTAFVSLGVLLAALIICALTGTVLYCKRRAEREYRERLAMLGMRPLAIKPIGLDRWEVPRERVVINRKLGTGAFGTVYGGHALLGEDRGWSAVAVKTLKAGATTEEKLDFLSEAEAMKRFDHKNVVRLLGVVTKTEPVCTVMEFMLYGDLKNYLLARRHLAIGRGEEMGEGDEVSPRRLTSMALDIARALSYLAHLRYVHRDVAARNCLVSTRRVVKLADFGMTRLVFENDYYRFSRKGMLPVRWMAPESLALGVFSPASDVWSFGVLLYEIVTFGSLPFQGLSNSEVLARVKAGNTLDLPPGLKPQLEGLIKSCWQQDSKRRPTASEVAAFLADAPRLLSPCLDVPLDAMTLDVDPPWKLSRDQAEARWVSWAAPASTATDTTYLSTDGPLPLETETFLP